MDDTGTSYTFLLEEDDVEALGRGDVPAHLQESAIDLLAFRDGPAAGVTQLRVREQQRRINNGEFDDVSKKMPAQRPNQSEQSVCTPPEFLRAVRRRFGIKAFAIDLAASADNAVAPLYYTEADDALKQPWRTSGRELGWLNPPFGDLAPWAEKAWRESRLGARFVMLVPAAVGANWWRDWIHGKPFVLFLNGRLTFVGHKQPYPKDCALMVYGPDVAPGYDVWTWPLPKKHATPMEPAA